MLHSMAYLPLQQSGNDLAAPCARYGKQYKLRDDQYKAIYEPGQPVFDLHCSKTSCLQVSTYDKMTSAVMELLLKLLAEDFSALGIDLVEVAEDHSTGTARITEPMKWVLDAASEYGDKNENPDASGMDSAQEAENLLNLHLPIAREGLENLTQELPEQPEEETSEEGMRAGFIYF